MYILAILIVEKKVKIIRCREGVTEIVACSQSSSQYLLVLRFYICIHTCSM